MILEYMIDGEAIFWGGGLRKRSGPARKNYSIKPLLAIRVSVKLDMCYFMCRRRIGMGTEHSTCPNVHRVFAFSDQIIKVFFVQPDYSRSAPDPV